MQALDPSDTPPLPSLTLPRVGTWRILLGLLQGLLLYLLYRAAKGHAWPATEFLLFVPLVLISGLGHHDASASGVYEDTLQRVQHRHYM